VSILAPLDIRRRAAARSTHPVDHSYFVVMIDHGKRGLEAVVAPELTRRDVIARLVSGEYSDVAFIHEVMDGLCDDVTAELIDAAEALARAEAVQERDSRADAVDHARDMRKHEVVS
jgi:hypothetical protein